MTSKLVKRPGHRVWGYLFSGVQLAAPLLLRFNPKTVNTFRVLGSGLLLFNAFARIPFGLGWLTSFKSYKQTNRLFLTGLSLLPVLKLIGRNKMVLSFAIGFAGTAATLAILNDNKAGQGG